MSRQFQARHPSVRKAAKEFSDWTRFKSDIRTAFADMVHIWVLSLRNAFMPRDEHWLAREAEFETLKTKFGDEGMDIAQGAFAALMLASRDSRGDHLGEMFQQVSANSKAMGQFFTPYTVSEVMARMAMTREMVDAAIAKQGYVLAQEPACGAGRMVIAMGTAIESLGLDPAKTLRVHAIDIDRIAVDMTFVQSTLQGVPCYVEQANALDPSSGEAIGYRFPNVHYATAAISDEAPAA